jgi:transcription elongation factor GreA
MNKQYLTPEGAEKLQEELLHLEGPAREKLALRLKSAIEMGDLSENADYIKAKEDQSFLEGRIEEIKYLLHKAEIIQENTNFDSIIIGAKVTIQEHDCEPEIYHLVGSKEANPGDGRISNASPIGQALLGKKIGEQVTANTPGGDIVFKILKIE